MIAKFTKSGAATLRRVIAREQRNEPKPSGIPVVATLFGFGICLFESMEAWNGSNDGSSVFPARILRWTGSALQNTGREIEIRDFMNFRGASGARGIAINLFSVWWHVTSTCPPTT